MRFILVHIFFIYLIKLHAQSATNRSDTLILNTLSQLDSQPVIISFTNSFDVNNEGGHLQGVQSLSINEVTYSILSGSSSTYSYYTIVKMGENNEVISLRKILNKPFKHAGGFQIYDHYLAVGIEDNEARNHSYVFLYDLSEPERPNPEPLTRIERQGPYERTTAGCVGMITHEDYCLVVVGDWNTKHLDFYNSNIATSKMSPFRLNQTMTIDSMDKSDWIDPEWLPYQNINLYQNDEGLYLFGMTSDANGNNVADLYALGVQDPTTFSIRKIGRKILGNQGGNFIWGAGIVTKDRHFGGIIGSERNLSEVSNLYFYKSENP